MDVMRAKLRDSESQRDKLHDALVAAEMRADRSQSAIVVKMHSRAATGDDGMKEEKIEEPERKLSSSPAVSGRLVGGSFDHSNPQPFLIPL
jgi:E3 ubiquitin-protein ligase BRE1